MVNKKITGTILVVLIGIVFLKRTTKDKFNEKRINMFDKKSILDKLDHFKSEYPYEFFPNMGDSEFALGGTRMTLFADSSNWAVVIEKMGFSLTGFSINNEAYYFGNCLINMEQKYDDNEKVWTNYRSLSIVKYDLIEPMLDHILYIKDGVDSILINNNKIAIVRDLTRYKEKGINIKTQKNFKNQIDFVAVTRYLIDQNYDLFVLSDEQIRKHVPNELPKLMTIRDWYHEDYNYIHRNDKYFGKAPSSYETFQLVADILVSKDTTKYKPLLKPNTHWSNWEKSDSNF